MSHKLPLLTTEPQPPYAMASAAPSTTVEEEAKCPICMELLTDPVTLDCCHNFCQACIGQHCQTWEDMRESLECPLCKAPIQKRSLQVINGQLANIVGQLKLLLPGMENLCGTHKKELNLFCKEDKKLVCVACERSPEHRSHMVLLREDAIQNDKVGNYGLKIISDP